MDGWAIRVAHRQHGWGGLTPSEEPAVPQGTGGPWAAQDTACIQPPQPLPWGHCPGVMARYSMAHRARAGDTPTYTAALIWVII